MIKRKAFSVCRKLIHTRAEYNQNLFNVRGVFKYVIVISSPVTWRYICIAKPSRNATLCLFDYLFMTSKTLLINSVVSQLAESLFSLLWTGAEKETLLAGSTFVCNLMSDVSNLTKNRYKWWEFLRNSIYYLLIVNFNW